MGAYPAIFLDAGFTILQMQPSWEELFFRVTRAHGLDFALAEVRQANATAQAFFDDYYYRPNDTWTDDQGILQFWTDYYRTGLQAVRCPPEVLEACAHDLACLLNETEAWVAYPDVAPVMAGLQRAGYTVGILSDWTSTLPEILDRAGVLQYADFVVVSAIERVAKPQPAFFQRALQRAGVEPHRALMVGDNLYADIEGAAGAGIAGILIDRNGRNQPAGVPTIHRLDELWTYLG